MLSWHGVYTICIHSCADPEGGGGGGGRAGGGGGKGRGGGGPEPPWKITKMYGFFKTFLPCSNTGSDPLKITKLPIQYSMLGHHLPASETPFK